jgi:RHS repeat-associated protein
MIRYLLFGFALLSAAAALGQEPTPSAPLAVKGLEYLKTRPDSGPTSWINGPYHYDGAGNIAAIGSEAYAYDKIGRLTSATLRGPGMSEMQTQAFVYDIYGNLKQTSRIGETVDLPTTSTTNQLDALTYDAAGNVITAGDEQLRYDAVGMLNTTFVGSGDSAKIVYAYTADDERLFAFNVVSGETHWTLRGLDNKLLRDFKQVGPVWTLDRDYIYRDGLLLAAMKSDGSAEHFSLDHLGTPRLVTDASGHRIGYHVYWPFGEEWSPGNAQEGSPLKFTGHERDAGSTGPLDYMHARYYSPGWGRFLAVDPTWDSADLSNPQAWNRYAYVTNSPILRTDPTGKLGLYPWERDPERLISAISNLALELVHYPEVKEAVQGYQSGDGKEKVLAGSAIGIAALDVGAMLLEPEEGAVEHLASGAEKVSIHAAEGGRLLPFKDAERLIEVNNTLDRMEHGVQKYVEDGRVFKNNEGLLPKQPEGYYKEFTVDTPGAPTRGQRRIVQGSNGETYYTDNHYRNFVQIDPAKHP